MAKIDFTDGTGAATLESLIAFPGNRFRNWVPASRPIGPGVPTLGTGEMHRWVFRTDHMASFEQPGLKASQLEIAARLCIHLLNGGTITITTTDSASRVYTARMAPDSEPSISGPDAETWEYTFAMVALNTAATVMRCTYSGPSS